MKCTVSLRQALDDHKLLGNVLNGDSWNVWRVLLIACMGEALTVQERAIFTQVTQRTLEPNRRVEEFLGIVGRRGGKSRAIATFASYLAGLCDHRDKLVLGETGVVLIIAPDQKQSGITLNYVEACFTQSTILRKLIDNRTSDTLELTNNISIEVRAASFRRLRGPTYCAVIADEAAFWYNDDTSSNPDVEILNAVRPGLASTGGPLVMITSPYARRGEAWEMHRQHFGAKGDPLLLVAQGASRIFNPSLPQRVVDRAFARDPAAASAEYGAEFRTDLEAYISREAAEACIEKGVIERAPVFGVKYVAFCDPSGGSRDSFTLCIAHAEDDKVVIDLTREIRAPFDPESAVDELCAALYDYRVKTVTGDKFAVMWVSSSFQKRGISFEHTEFSKSSLYLDLLPRINSKQVVLLDDSRTLNQLVALERRTARGGRDTIDHPPNGFDDLINAVAGAVSLVAKPKPQGRFGSIDVYGFVHWEGEQEQREPSARVMQVTVNEAGEELSRKLISP